MVDKPLSLQEMFGRLDEQEVDDFSDEENREIDNEHVDMTPFKPMEVKI